MDMKVPGNLKRLPVPGRLALLLLFRSGCSTAPVADMLDYFKPGKFEQGKAAPYGGVCGPQQAGAIVVPPQPFAAGPAVPGPAGIPTLGNANPPSTPLPPPDFGVPPPGR